MKKFYMVLAMALWVGSTSLLSNAFCADYTAEVMMVKGSASVVSADGQTAALKEGDLLKVGSVVQVEKDSYVDLAYDSQWNNVTRIGAESKVKVRSIYPTDLYMDKGDMLAKLHKLPANSTFEIETPTAVAAVRGSEYRTVVRDGATDVFNLHNSEVEVHSKDIEGRMMQDFVLLKENEKTGIEHLGESPKAPEVSSEREIKESRAMGGDLSSDVQEKVDSGEIGKTQDIEKVEKGYSDDLAKRIETFRQERQEKEEASAPNDPKGLDSRESIAENEGNEGSAGSEVRDGEREPLSAQERHSPEGREIASDRIAERAGDRIEHTADRAETKVREIVERVDNKVRDVTDRTDRGQGRRDDRGSDNSGGSGSGGSKKTNV